MDNSAIRLLRADEIECRAAAVSEKGLSLLLYKDARVDQRILDETFGIFGWKRSHQSIEGNLYCTVEIFDKERNVWVSKQDVGTVGMAEKEKSQASDSFKRACFNWGIGRELYTAPFIWIPADRADIQKRGNRFVCSSRFTVKAIAYNADREIISLTVCGEDGKTVYAWKEKSGTQGGQMPGSAGSPSLTKGQMELLEKELERTGVEFEAVQDRYQIGEPGKMTGEVYQKVMSALAKTKSAGAA